MVGIEHARPAEGDSYDRPWHPCGTCLSQAGTCAQVTVRAFTVVPTRSGVLRDLREREILDLLSARLAAVSLSGYIFFGSSVSISDQVGGRMQHSPGKT